MEMNGQTATLDPTTLPGASGGVDRFASQLLGALLSLRGTVILPSVCRPI